MWTRRLLLAMLVAACALSLPARHAPSTWNVSLGNAQIAPTAR